MNNLKEAQQQCDELRAAHDARAEARIEGVEPEPGMYLVHDGRGRTYGRVVEVRGASWIIEGKGDSCRVTQTHWTRVLWESATTGSRVESDPFKLREGAYRWSREPLDDYTPRAPLEAHGRLYFDHGVDVEACTVQIKDFAARGAYSEAARLATLIGEHATAEYLSQLRGAHPPQKVADRGARAG